MKLRMTLLLPLVFLIACSVPRKYRESMYCYTGKSTGLDTLLNIHGYYTNRDSEKVKSYSTSSFMFSPDGIFIADASINNYLEKVLTTPGLKTNSLYFQGIYRVFNDTIKVQYLNPGQANTWSGFEIWYKIIDKNTVADIYFKLLAPSNGDKNYPGYIPQSYVGQKYSHFIFVENIPEVTTWLKNEKWFYCK